MIFGKHKREAARYQQIAAMAIADKAIAEVQGAHVFGVDEYGFLTVDGEHVMRQVGPGMFQMFRCGEPLYNPRNGEHEFAPAIRETQLLADALNELVAA